MKDPIAARWQDWSGNGLEVDADAFVVTYAGLFRRLPQDGPLDSLFFLYNGGIAR